jgi:hypothetical protein
MSTEEYKSFISLRLGHDQTTSMIESHQVTIEFGGLSIRVTGDNRGLVMRRTDGKPFDQERVTIIPEGSGRILILSKDY